METLLYQPLHWHTGVHPPSGKKFADGFPDNAARHLTGCSTAHTVGNQKTTFLLPDQAGILIMGAYPARVGAEA